MTRKELIAEARKQLNEVNSKLYILQELETMIPEGQSKESVIQNVIDEADIKIEELNKAYSQLKSHKNV